MSHCVAIWFDSTCQYGHHPLQLKSKCTHSGKLAFTEITILRARKREAKMLAFFEVVRNYPLLWIALVFTPLAGGIVGAYLGFENLSTRLAREQQQQRIESRQEAIKNQIDGLSIPIESLRHYERALQAQGQNFDVLRLILAQYDQLHRALAMREQFLAAEDSR